MSTQIVIESAVYDAAGRVSFAWTRLHDTTCTNYIAEIRALGTYKSFTLNDIAAATSMVPYTFTTPYDYTLQISAADDQSDIDSSTTSARFKIAR